MISVCLNVGKTMLEIICNVELSLQSDTEHPGEMFM